MSLKPRLAVGWLSFALLLAPQLGCGEKDKQPATATGDRKAADAPPELPKANVQPETKDTPGKEATPPATEPKAPAESAKEPPAAVPPSDPWEGLNSKERAYLTDLEKTIEPYAKKAGNELKEALQEQEQRLTAIMKLSRVSIDPEPEQMQKILKLISRIEKIRAHGSVYTATVERDTLWSRGKKAVEKTIDNQITKGPAINKAARKLLIELNKELPSDQEDNRLPVFEETRREYPNLVLKQRQNALLVSDLTPWLFYLYDEARRCEWHRKRDSKLHAIISAFDHKDRFRILFAMRHGTGAQDTPDIRVKDGKLKNDGRLERRDAEELLKAFDLEKYETNRRHAMSNLFKTFDEESVASLVEIQAAIDELTDLIRAAAPDFKHRFRRVVERGPDGKATAAVLPAIDFGVINTKDYVARVYIDAVESIVITGESFHYVRLDLTGILAP